MTKNKKPKERILKVEEVGDFWTNRVYSRIRIKGKWVHEAGFPPNSHVKVTNPKPGKLIFYIVEEKEI